MLELGKQRRTFTRALNADEVSGTCCRHGCDVYQLARVDSSFNDPAIKSARQDGFSASMPGAQVPGRAEIGNWLIAIPPRCEDKDAAFVPCMGDQPGADEPRHAR